MKTKILKRSILGYALLCLTLAFIVGVPVRAAEPDSAESMTLQQTVKDAQMKEEPDKSADTLAELPMGTAVIVYGEPQDSWSRIEYDGMEGYIESSALEAYNTGDMIREFAEIEDENIRIVDEYELVQESRKKSIIWGTVIAVLVIGIFAVGIISAVKKNKEGEQE